MPYTEDQISQILSRFNAPSMEAAPATSIQDLRAPIEPTQAMTEAQQLSVYDEYQKAYQETQRKRQRGAEYIANKMLQNQDQAEIINKALTAKLNADVPEMPRFEQTEPAKKIMESIPSFEKRDFVIRNIKKELEDASKIENPQEKMQRIFTILPKMIQSAGTGGTDALQPAEVILGLTEAQTIFTWASANKKNLYDPMTWVEIKTDPVLSNAFTADPDAYIKKAKAVYNSISSTRNETLNQFERMSSKDWVRKNTGLQLLDQFSDQDLQRIPARPNTAATFSIGPGGAPVRTEAAPPVQGVGTLKKAYYNAAGKLVIP
jgi:hypothetical protein